MTSLTPTDAQARAIAAIKTWFETRTHEQQVFRLFGYAGTGKSTVVKFALDELGLAPHRSARDGPLAPGVVTATFTGKAALVLRRKGTPARTIHSLIYSVVEATEAEIEAAMERIDRAQAAVRMRNPEQGDHRFHGKATTESTAIRPPVPRDRDHRFRWKSTTSSDARPGLLANAANLILDAPSGEEKRCRPRESRCARSEKSYACTSPAG